MGAGNLLLAFLAVRLSGRQILALSFLDRGCSIVAGSVVASRLLDVARLRGVTVDGTR